MLKIKNIKFGLIPTGPAIGTSAIQIFFEETEEIYEKDDYDLDFNKWRTGFNTENGMIDESPRELFSEFYEKIQKLESQFQRAIDGSHSCFIVYMGGEIDRPDNFDEFNRFQIDLGNRSRNYQVALGKKVDKLKPTFNIFVGTPTYMTGKNQFYELFNIVYPIIKIREDEITKYNALALQECLNSPFGIATIDFEGGSELDIIDIVEKYHLPNHKVLIIDNTKKSEISEFVKTYFYKYYPYLKGKNFLDITK
jgi:hypothetical protein